jgi:MSHA biogenesis protein MshI
VFGLGKKRFEKDLLVSVCANPIGIAVAGIRRGRDVPPALEICDYRANTDSGSDLRGLIRTHELDKAVCASVMDLGSYSLLQVEAPDVPPDELRAAIRWRVKDLIDFHIDDAVIDVFEVPDSKAAGKKKMYVVAARADQVRQRIDSLLESGLRLEVIDIPELALRNVAALLPEDVNGVAMIYLEENEGLITITRQETLYLSRRIRFGYNSLPDTAVHGQDREAIEGWLDGITVEVQRSLDYYESHFSQPQVSGLVITPGRIEIPDMAAYLSAQLGLPARILNVNELIDFAASASLQIQPQCLLAIGAALRQESRAL